MMAATPARRGIVRSLVLFTAAQVLLIAAVAWGLSQFIWTGPEAARAIHISAWVAVAVQVVTFTIARLVAREQAQEKDAEHRSARQREKLKREFENIAHGRTGHSNPRQEEAEAHHREA